MHYRYWGKSMHMSADLKVTAHRVRTRRPEYFSASGASAAKSLSDEGKVTSHARAQSMSGRAPRLRNEEGLT